MPKPSGAVRWLSALLGLLLGVCSGSPDAAYAAPAAQGEAAALRQEGEQALAAGDLARAQERIEASFTKEPVPETLSLLGHIAKARGEFMLAADLYRRYLNAVQDVNPVSDRETLLPLIEAQQELGGEVTVYGSSGAVVLVDTRVVGVLPLNLPILMSSGSHTVELRGTAPAAAAQVTVKVKRHALITFVSSPSGQLLPLIKESPAVLLLPLPDSLPQPVSAAVRQAVQQGLVADNKAVLIARDATVAVLRRIPAPATCMAAEACLASLLARVNASYAVRVNLEPGSGQSIGGGSAAYHLAVQLFAGSSEEWSRVEVAGCDGCSLERAMESLREQTSQLMQQALNQAFGSLVITTQPAGASVTIKGRLRGTTPYEREVPVGSYMVSLAKRGYTPVTDSAVVEDGKTVRLHYDLPAEAIVGNAEGKRSALRAAGWTLLGIGAAALVLGGSLWGLDGYQSCDVAATLMCPLELDSRTAGIALVAGGGAAFVMSIALIGIDYRRTHGRRESALRVSLAGRQ